jgi:hypothetical protein
MSAFPDAKGDDEMSNGTSRLVSPGSSDIPFREILVGLRARNISGIAKALRDARPDEIADALRDRDPQRIIDAALQNEVTAIVDALLECDQGKLDELRRGRESKKIAAALLSRNSKELATALRGRNIDRVREALSDNDLDRTISALRDRGAGRKAHRLSDADVESLKAALPEDTEAIKTIADALCARDPVHALSPLSHDEATQIATVLKKTDREKIIRVLLATHGAIWEQILNEVTPKVALAIKRKFSDVPELVGEDAVLSLAQSMTRTILRRAELGKLQDYDLDSAEDVAGLFIQIAWRKGCKRLREEHAISIRDLPLGLDDPAATEWEPADSTEGPEEELIEQEIREQFHDVLGELEKSLECIDRVILQNKLRFPRVTNEVIADEVVKQCQGYQMCSVRTVRRHWSAIVARLRAQLEE